MRLFTAAIALTLVSALSGCDSPLQRAKKQAITKLAAQDADLLKRVPLEVSDLGSAESITKAVEVDGGVIYVPDTENLNVHGAGTALDYSVIGAGVTSRERTADVTRMCWSSYVASG